MCDTNGHAPLGYADLGVCQTTNEEHLSRREMVRLNSRSKRRALSEMAASEVRA